MTQAVELTGPPGPEIRRPHASLRAYVDSYYGYQYEVSQPGVHRGLPSSVMTVVLAFDTPLDVGWYAQPQSRGAHWALASGLHTIPAEIHHAGPQSGIQLGFTAAGARATLGLPMAALAADIVPLDELLPKGMRDLHARVAELTAWEARYDALDRGLRSLVSRRGHDESTHPRSELTWAWQRIVDSDGRERVTGLASELGWSRRHLTGQFRAEFGLSPKQLARVSRFQQSRDLIASGRALADVAALAGFADQAHLTREWRTMTGYTPREWRREEFPFVQDLALDH